MGQSKEGRSVAPANGKKATKKDRDWKEICKDCDIVRLGNDCTFGCEFLKASLRKTKRNGSG